MWRAFVLAFAALTVFLTFNSNFASAVGSKGGWNSASAGGGLNVAYADFNHDCLVDVLDEQSSAYRYGSSFGLPLYDNYWDVEPQSRYYDYPPKPYYIGDDWDIDIKDLQVVFGRDSLSCVLFWDPDVLMGEYSYRKDTPTGPTSTSCNPVATDPPGWVYEMDPIGVVFYQNATASRLKQEARDHGFPSSDDDPEQRFWEVGRCSFEDVDVWYDWSSCPPECNPHEQFHFRAEVADQESHIWWSTSWPTTWGIYATAPPHFDDDDNWCGHFVPEEFPHPEWLYPGFSGSGFEAGTYWTVDRFVTDGGHQLGGIEYWGNDDPIPQSCGDNQWPAGNGYVYYINIP